MRLRNKKTGEVVEAIERGAIDLYFYLNKNEGGTDFGRKTYNSISELNDEWEYYEPKEPLIKDEKIRKAVRAWADANGIGGCICKEEIHCITFETERGMFISFEDADPIPPEGNYTINELCGEEENEQSRGRYDRVRD